jgi:4'-phosphopantetheinyl transferase
VECIREFKDSLARYTMNDAELTDITASANAEAVFIRLWTMKEATAKLIGTGITHDVKSLIDTTRYKYTTVERQWYTYTICENL